MSWRLKHKLFGWDYIAVYGDTRPHRIYVDGEGLPYIERGNYIQIIKPNVDVYTWLTCKRTKYIKEVEP